MADINIERKRKSPLPWIIGLLVLGLLAFMLMRNRGGEERDTGAGTVTDTTTSVTPNTTTAP